LGSVGEVPGAIAAALALYVVASGRQAFTVARSRRSTYELIAIELFDNLITIGPMVECSALV
jgi:hypothetical protein